MEDKMIPDILLEILRHNDITEEVSLYSVENQVMYTIRKNIMDKVVKDMTKEVLLGTIDTVVSQYLRQRALKGGKDPNDPLDGKYLDPLALAANSLMNDVLRKEIRGMLKNELGIVEDKQDTILKDYLLEASFIPYFNNVLLKDIIRETA
jgi:hypothetical protein